MTAASPRAAIVIPHYNDVARLRLCLAALAPQQAAIAPTVVEIVVADNGSTDDLAPLRRDFPQVRFIDAPLRGAAAARNAGVAASTAPWLFFTDADCIPADDWLATALAHGDYAGVTGGRVDVFDETPPPRTGAQAFETVFAFPQRHYIETKGYSVTANMLTTRAVFDRVGPFDRTRVEDQDWGERACAAGFPIRYADTLRVAHPTRSTWPALRRKWRRVASELYFRNGTGPRARAVWALRGLAVLASGPAHLPRVLRHPGLTPTEKLRAAGTLLALRTLRCGWMLQQAMRGEAPIHG